MTDSTEILRRFRSGGEETGVTDEAAAKLLYETLYQEGFLDYFGQYRNSWPVWVQATKKFLDAYWQQLHEEDAEARDAVDFGPYPGE